MVKVIKPGFFNAQDAADSRRNKLESGSGRIIKSSEPAD